MKFEIRERPENKRVRQLIRELPDRVRAIIEYMPAGVAVKVLDELNKTAPSDIAGYPDMLVLRRFQLQGVDSTVGVVAPGSAHSQKLRMEDAADTALYIKAKRGSGGAPDAGAVILAQHNPWTMETLPYEPSKRQAIIVSRKVSPREHGIIIARRTAEKSEVVAQLQGIGIEPGRIHPTLLQRRVGRDIAFEVMRREFGFQGQHDAHWRPAIRKARTTFVVELLKKPFIRWLAVPSEQRWRKKVAIKPERAGTAKRLQGFQDVVANAGR